MKQKDKVLITGVAGFLGSHLLDRLMADGHPVTGIDNLSMGKMENINQHLENEWFTFIKGDVTENETFARLDDDFNVVVHLAAFKIPRYGKAIDTLQINNRGTEMVLEFTREQNCKCVIASTSDVYGMSPNIPFKEDDICVVGTSKIPRWSYAASKLYDEHLAFAFQDAYGFPVTLLRFFGSYGPRQHKSWWGGPQSVFIDSILNDQPIPIHGDGSQTRTFTYVSDTVAGIFESIVSPSANGEIINIGANQEVTILELAKTIKRIINNSGELKLEFIPYDKLSPGKKYQDVMRRVPDTTLCEKLLGVKAVVSLDDGLRKTIEWQMNEMELSEQLR